MSQAKNNNLQSFRKEVKKFLIAKRQYGCQRQDAALQIRSFQQLKQLVNHLCDQKLLNPQQVKKIITKLQPASTSSQLNQQQQSQIKKKLVTFPLPSKQLQSIIMVEFGDQNCQNLLTDLKKFKILLRQVKGVMNVWKDKGLTNDEKAELQSIFAKGNDSIAKLCQQLYLKKQILQNISEQEIQMIKALDEWISMQNVVSPFKNYLQFQKANSQTINSLFNKIQVKQVHFKKNQSNLKVTDILKVKGYNSKNDEPVQVVLVSKTSINFEKINKELIKFDALKQLSLSQHFPRFLGFNTHSSPSNIQYFLESIETKNICKLMKQQKSLTIDSPLIKYWMHEIYMSFYDLFLMCSYQPQLPIRLEDFQVKDYGLGIVLQNIRFVKKRDKINCDKTIDQLQTKLLHNLGIVLLELLGISKNFDEIDNKLSKLEQRCFFKSLLNVVESHKNFQRNIIENRLSFFNLQTHPLVEQSQFSQGSNIVESYVAIFGYE